jgi:hypothetical protein
MTCSAQSSERIEGVRESGEDYAAAVQRILKSGGIPLLENLWWIRSGIAGFADDARDHFFCRKATLIL